METNDIDYKEFTKDYIARCEAVKDPLSRHQIGILEQTITERLDAPEKHLSASPENEYDNRIDRMAVDQAGKVSNYRRTQGLINAIKSYRHDSTEQEIDVTDGDALALYEFVAEEVKHRNISEIKKKSYLPGSFGWGALRTLHRYLQIKGFVDASEDVPRQPKHQSLRKSPNRPAIHLGS